MGLEALCQATLDGARSRGKALLETTELIFRGDFRVRVPLGEVKRADVDGDRLVIRFGDRQLALELGPAEAQRWGLKIRNPPSRLDKLGVKPTSRVAVLGRLDDDFLAELAARAAAVARGAPRTAVDILFYAARARADLGRLGELRARIAPDGAVWVVRPKGQAAVTESDVMQAGKDAGLVDVKVAAFSPTHTAHKFVIPVGERATRPATATARSPRPDPSRTRPGRNRPPTARARDRRA